MPSLAKTLSRTLEVVHGAGRLLLEHHQKPRTIRHKGRIDIVTEADTALEAFLKDGLAPIVPQAGFMAEESAVSLDPGDCCWIIDPVDGTTNFAHSIPLTAISVGLWQQGEIVLGVVHAPLLGECYSAAKGQGAFCNGVSLRVSGTDSLEQALAATGFPYAIERELPAVMGRLSRVLPAVQGVRRCGAASLDLAWLAAGRFDVFYEDTLKPWDVAAGWLLVEEAGGAFTCFDGSPFILGKGEVLASNGRLHGPMKALLSARDT